jgi:hypothetical protein
MGCVLPSRSWCITSVVHKLQLSAKAHSHVCQRLGGLWFGYWLLAIGYKREDRPTKNTDVYICAKRLKVFGCCVRGFQLFSRAEKVVCETLSTLQHTHPPTHASPPPSSPPVSFRLSLAPPPLHQLTVGAGLPGRVARSGWL